MDNSNKMIHNNMNVKMNINSFEEIIRALSQIWNSDLRREIINIYLSILFCSQNDIYIYE